MRFFSLSVYNDLQRKRSLFDVCRNPNEVMLQNVEITTFCLALAWASIGKMK